MAKTSSAESGNSPLASDLLHRIADRHQLNPNQVAIGTNLDDVLAISGISMDATLVASPDHDTGRMLPIHQAVRLARASGTLVIDERAGGFALRDHLPLFREFEHVVLVRSLDAWLAPFGASFTYALTKRPVSGDGASTLATFPAETARFAAATLADTQYVDAAHRQVMRERVMLFRRLRKLNMVRPMLSASSFIPATIERGDRDALRTFLASRDILVHYPDGPHQQNQIRISAVSRAATERLALTLIEWARDL